MRLAALAGLALASFLPPGEARAAAGEVLERTRSHAAGDIDGDGAVDHVFGYPTWSGSRGAIVVVTGAGEVVQLDRTNPAVFSTAQGGDNFGDSVAVGDIDGDGFDDVAVGVPGDIVYEWALGGSIAHSEAGSLHIFYGSSDGLSTAGDQSISRESWGIGAGAEQDARFGESVALADFNCDGFADLAVGAPLDDAHTGRVDDGSVHVIRGGSGGLTTVDVFYHQGSSSVSGAPESYDEFGAALGVGNFNGREYLGRDCMDLAVGVPGENTDSGYMVFFYGHEDDFLTFETKTGLSQNVAGVDGNFESHDAFGAEIWAYNPGAWARDDLLVAVSGEVCSNNLQGGIHRFRSTSAGFVTNKVLNRPNEDVLECMAWNENDLLESRVDYEVCLDTAGAACIPDLEDAYTDYGFTSSAHVMVASCLNAIDEASLRCEHWISDPVCDVDACIAAALELNTMPDACDLEGDIVNHVDQ